ncbi:MAG: DNA-directed RNA polymerase subunit G [Desulfurococcales archaeon]|nr:DNA-directed RNA polymerase subunit G [Desulfurococcales archaeon]
MATIYESECKISSKVEKSELPRTRIYKCKPVSSKEALIQFDMLEDVMYLGPGRKIVVSFMDDKPDSLDEYSFCGKAKLVSVGNNSLIYSIGGFIFKIVNPDEIINTRPEEFYLCIKT